MLNKAMEVYPKDTTVVSFDATFMFPISDFLLIIRSFSCMYTASIACRSIVSDVQFLIIFKEIGCVAPSCSSTKCLYIGVSDFLLIMSSRCSSKRSAILLYVSPPYVVSFSRWWDPSHLISYATSSIRQLTLEITWKTNTENGENTNIVQ